VNIDGDFDNGVIAHEYGHGISTRLAGGRNSRLETIQIKMGEGWSDWFALMMQLKPGDVGASKRGIILFLLLLMVWELELTFTPRQIYKSNDL
jgi:hypothetical protein